MFCLADCAAAHAWLPVALAQEMALGWPLATIVYGALVVLLAVLPAAAFAIAAQVFSQESRAMFAPLALAAGAPLAGIAAQYLVGFAWNSAGYSALATPLASLYSTFGVHGVAALVTLTAGTAGAALAEFAWRRDLAAAARGLQGLTLLIVVLVAAFVTNYLAREPQPSVALRARLVQPAVTQLAKFDGERMRAIARQLATLARDDSAQLVVAPETALPHAWSALPDDVSNSLLEVVAGGDRLWLLGMFEVDPELGLLNVSNGLRANSRDAAPQHYIKHRLVPVAERPTAGLRWLSDALALRYPARAESDDLSVVFRVSGVGVRTTICLDLAFGGDLSATAAATGVIVNQSNLAALPGERVRAQFTTIARVRALEQRKPLLLVANDGPTAVIDADGAVLASLPAGRDGAVTREVVARDGSTLYATLGEGSWLTLLAFAALGVVLRRMLAESRALQSSNRPDARKAPT